MKVVAIIQARMGSTRLPGKIMKKVLGKPLLEYQIEQVKRSRLIHQIVIATTTKEHEQPIIDLCTQLSVDYYRGSEDDVLSRYFETANHYKGEVIVRLTSDCPLLDPETIDKIISKYLENPNKYDYVSNTLDRTYPRGFDVEVFSMGALEQAYNEAANAAEREHVTPYIYLHPNKFKAANVKHRNDLSSYRLTVDTEADLDVITLVITDLYSQNKTQFQLEDIIQLLQKNQEWALINAHIEQKKVIPPKTKPSELEE
ncbi:glycosyltransferase family protein [Neobacillus drentensis]|uniref:glycosyltransferase family protein n=1 Tax=Neobacillus drentensis TaxID=220684 RepID=UPI001F3DE48D|nr:glycosyltransferase family protein [Neobacillus drentensis]ULT56476.1 glycosyltransferase family protein [Neobacillus drentensis]